MRPRAGAARDIAILLAVCAVAFFLGLGEPPVRRTQEARVLETAREMGETGELVVPRFCGELRFQKPPLAYWLALGGYWLMGAVDEAGGRAYSAVAGTLAVLLLYAFGRRLGAPRIGLWAGIVLATSYLFLRSARSAETDVLLATTITAALYAFHRAFEGKAGAWRMAAGGEDPQASSLKPQVSWLLAAWAAMAVGFMAKGPPAIGLPVLVILLHLAGGRRFHDMARVFSPWGIGLFIALAAPWFIAVLARGAWEVFHKELETTAAGEDHGKGFFYALFYYPVRVWADFLPWCALIPGIALSWRRSRAVPGARFFLAWMSAMLVALLLVGNKQPHYLIPLLPALAWLTGAWIVEVATALVPGLARWVPRCAAIVAIGILAGFTLWILVYERATDDGKEREALREFGRAARTVVRDAPIYLWSGDHAPAFDYYLGRVAKPVGWGSSGLQEVPRTGEVYLLVPNLYSPPPEELPAEPRFRLRRVEGDWSSGFLLYRADAAGPDAVPAAGSGETGERRQRGT